MRVLSTPTRSILPAYPDLQMRPKFLTVWTVTCAGNQFRIESIISAGFAHIIDRSDPKRCLSHCVLQYNLKNYECPPTPNPGRV